MIAFSIFQNDVGFAETVKSEVLEDSVEHWFQVKKKDESPWFFRQVENIFDIILPREQNLPFGKSVAFLVGVSRYEHISPQLPFVRNDLKQLRNFLLNKGGFDEVYIAADKIVTRDLVENYMFNVFPEKLKKQDRLLFYYSGHGADIKANTGYMRFSKAKPDQYISSHVLGIDECEAWSKIIKVKHILFIYDCCASGLAFTEKSGKPDSYRETLRTLSDNGSRTVITAGTSDQKTFGVGENSVFTKAFLNSFEKFEDNRKGFITISEIFARIELEVNEFARRYDKKLTPKRWELEEDKYNGTFLFVDTNARNPSIPDEYSNVLQAKPKGEVIGAFGMIKLITFVNGDVYIDDEYMRKVESGDGAIFVNRAF